MVKESECVVGPLLKLDTQIKERRECCDDGMSECDYDY